MCGAYDRPRVSRAWTAGVVAFGLLAASCGAQPGRVDPAGTRNSFDVLTGDEVREASAENLYEAIQELRPRWLRPRPRTSITFERASDPIVYLYGVRHGSINTLYQMHVNQVVQVEYINPLDATTRYGAGHGGGVILVDLARF